MKEILKLAIISLISISLITGCSNENKAHEFYPSYSYESLLEISDIIVTGEVIKSHKAEKINVGKKIKGNNAESITSTYTVCDVKIIDVIKGNVKTGDIIQVKQLGNKNGAKNEQVEKYGYFKENNEYVLFLTTFEEGMPYSTLSPVQGHLNIIDNEIIVNKDNKLFKNMEKNDFLREIKLNNKDNLN